MSFKLSGIQQISQICVQVIQNQSDKNMRVSTKQGIPWPIPDEQLADY